MDMTGWLDYFVGGLETQMTEVKQRGERIIRRDVMARKHGLNERQGTALDVLLRKGNMHISELEGMCLGVSRRTLQRDLGGLIKLGLIKASGAARQSTYELAE